MCAIPADRFQALQSALYSVTLAHKTSVVMMRVVEARTEDDACSRGEGAAKPACTELVECVEGLRMWTKAAADVPGADITQCLSRLTTASALLGTIAKSAVVHDTQCALHALVALEDVQGGASQGARWTGSLSETATWGNLLKQYDETLKNFDIHAMLRLKQNFESTWVQLHKTIEFYRMPFTAEHNEIRKKGDLATMECDLTEEVGKLLFTLTTGTDKIKRRDAVVAAEAKLSKTKQNLSSAHVAIHLKAKDVKIFK